MTRRPEEERPVFIATVQQPTANQLRDFNNAEKYRLGENSFELRCWTVEYKNTGA
jgi:hypothetical protein